jgi:hypothetical protein
MRKPRVSNFTLSWLWIILVPWIMGVSSCPNALSEFADKKSDDALLFDARTSIDKRDWTSAITSINSMTSSGLAKHDTKIALASAYAGRCGLDLILLADAVSSQISSTKIWPILMKFMNGVSSTADCKTAEATALTVASADRTSDDNVFLAFVEFAKMGAVLAVSGANSSGSISGSFNSCTNNAANILDADVGELGTGLTITVSALNAAGSTIGGTTISTVSSLCTTIDGLTGTPGFCNKTTAAQFSANELLAIRALIKSNELGFNTCSGAVFSTGACSCP